MVRINDWELPRERDGGGLLDIVLVPVSGLGDGDLGGAAMLGAAATRN